MDDNPGLRYELINVNPLPCVDVTKSVKSVLLSKRGLMCFNWVMRAINKPSMLLYMIALPLGLSVLLVREETGRVIGIFQLVFQLPLLALGIGTLGVDILWCLLRTYEFWLFSIMNCANSAAYGAYLGDARIILLPAYWLGIYMNICVDANLQTRQLVSGSSAAIVYHLVVINAVALQLTPNSHTSTMLRYNKRAMTTNDFLLNSLGTMTILMTRTAYRKRTHLKKKVECSSRFQCVSYRCRVKLQVKDDTPLHHVGQGPLFDAMSDEVRVVTASLTKQHLRFVNHGTTFLPEDFVYSSIAQRVLHQRGSANGQSSGWWARCVLLGSGFSSIVFTALGYVCENYSLSVLGSSGVGNCAVSTIGLPSMLSFSVVFTSCLNRGSLRELMFSFDFAFVSVQLMLAHLCVCDLFFWDIRCVTMLFMWLSMHWVLLLDALIPSVKQQPGLRTKAAIPVAMLFLVWMLHIIGDLLFESSSVEYQDRTVWIISVFDHSTDFRVVAFFFSRVWTLMLWSLRILWRTWQSGDDDMITIQGNVEFIASRAVLGNCVQRDTASFQLKRTKMREWTMRA